VVHATINHSNVNKFKFYHCPNLGSDRVSRMDSIMKYVVMSLAGLALVGCTQTTPAPVVTVTAPAPVVTSTPAPVETNEYQGALEYAWSTLSVTEKEDVCYIFEVSPQEAWEAFNSTADGSIPQNEFNKFFVDQCLTY
jgi:hypothetical protein